MRRGAVGGGRVVLVEVRGCRGGVAACKIHLWEILEGLVSRYIRAKKEP